MMYNSTAMKTGAATHSSPPSKNDNPTSVNVNVLYRGKNGCNFKLDITHKSGNTVLELKKYVKDKLNQDPYVEGLILDVHQIRIFQKAEQGQHELTPLLDDAQGLTNDATYVAMGYFSTVPSDMLRTVRLDQLEPLVYSNPDIVDRSFTKFSPLYCAAMTTEEKKFPAISWSTKENKESVCMTLQDYQMLLPHEERLHASHPDLCILCTTLTHEIDGDNNNIYIPKDELEPSDSVGWTRSRR
eukprot:scaffold243048_cov68-Attheya_sp.AAC.1